MKREELTPIDLECNMGPDVNGVVQREPWKAYDIDEVNLLLDENDAEIASLKAENEQLKSKLESVQASAYADSADAGMRERRLRRALWLARAERAKEKEQLFLFSLGYEKLCIDGFFDPYNGRKELSPKQWVKVFKKVENKCLDKAEEFK